ncbi:MAG TPA: alpha/beta fold hydrolase [Thermohalobaculum sp.]|nr:alpha/beta fold hydrolase [Thermohalobaculum sp.]
MHYATATDGTRLAWSADGEGPPIVRGAHWMTHLHHDWESPIWGPWMTELSGTNRFVRFDQRCNGLSDRGVADISFERMVDDIGTVADAAGLDEFVLLGVSQSCAYSIAYAVRHPERVRGLVLYGGFARGWRARGDPAEIARREAMNTLLRHGWGTDDPTFRQLFTQMFRPGATPEQASWYNELQRQAATQEDAIRLAEASGQIDVEHLLDQVVVPTLVLHANRDLVAPVANGRHLAERIPGARFVELDGENHILTAGEPAFRIFVDETRAFAESVFAASRRPAPGPAAADEAPAAPHAPLPGTRRRITVLEADIVSPLQAFEEMDAELALGTLAPLIDAARGAIESSGGEVLEASDTGLTAAFGARESSEVHAVLAARVALGLRSAIEKASGGRARVRIALDSGEVIVSTATGGLSARGAVIRQARRLCYALRRATVALSERTRQAAGGYIRTEPMERTEHPGVSRDQTVHELVALSSANSRWHLRAHRSLSRFVGRQAECEMLGQHWRRAAAGQGQVVLIPAEPGVGKSRLTHEFLSGQDPEGCTVVESGALELEREVPFSVMKPLIRALFGLGEDESGAAQARTLVRALERLGVDPALATPLSLAIDLDVEDPDWEAAASVDRVRRIAEAVRVAILSASRERPLLILLEDLHWMDRESREVLDRLVGSLDRHRVMLLATARPEFRHDWADRSAVHVLRLHPLDIEDAQLLVRDLVGDDPSTATLRRLLVERTDGTPLLIEETVRALEQAGRIAGKAGAFVATGPLVDLEISSSVTQVIAGRIDRLPPTERRILQVTAVLGRVARRPMLQELAGLAPEALAEGLAALERHEFLFEVLAFPEPEYAFKHALIRDVAYGSLLAEDRRRLHAAAFAATERAQDDGGERVETLADHAFRAELWEPAARYLAQAAERAIERSAYPAATLSLERAIQALDAQPPAPERTRLAIDVRLSLRLAYMANGDYVLGVMRLKEARDIADASGDVERQVRALLHLSYLHSTFGRLEKAIRAAENLKEIAAANGLARYVAEGDLAACQALLLRSGAREALERLEPHFERFTTEWRNDRFGLFVTRAVWYLGCLGFARALTGDFQAAERHLGEAETIAAEAQRPIDAYAAAYYRNVIGNIRGPTEEDVERMRAVAEDCLDRAPYPFLPWLLSTWGHAQIRLGRFAEAVETLERARDAADAVHMVHFARVARALRAYARARLGEDVRDDLLAAGARAEKDGDCELLVRILRALARIEDGAAAVRHLERALEIAEACDFRPARARLLIDLGERLAGVDPARAADVRDEGIALLRRMGLEAEADAAARTGADALGAAVSG